MMTFVQLISTWKAEWLLTLCNSQERSSAPSKVLTITTLYLTSIPRKMEQHPSIVSCSSWENCSTSWPLSKRKDTSQQVSMRNYTNVPCLANCRRSIWLSISKELLAMPSKLTSMTSVSLCSPHSKRLPKTWLSNLSLQQSWSKPTNCDSI